MRPSYAVSRLEYDLPRELIAQHPLPGRSASRLLHVNVAHDSFTDESFIELPRLLPAESLLVFNNSKVIPARIIGRRRQLNRHQGGGRVEVLYHRWIGEGDCEVIVGSNAALAGGETIELPDGWSAELLEPKALSTIRVVFRDTQDKRPTKAALLAYLELHGSTPLPPYIHREDEKRADAAVDSRRYQTVYARETGSVAAPTAGLHFDDEMLATLGGSGHQRCEFTLHVGYGTFAPVRVDDLAEHRMHSEDYSALPDSCSQYFQAKAGRQPVAAVGTTSQRILHTLSELDSDQQKQACTAGWNGSTDAFIYPGHITEAADLLLTNFHLPRSTLLALVYAFGGEELMRRAYEHAIESEYRFFSYGDCMLIDRRGGP